MSDTLYARLPRLMALLVAIGLVVSAGSAQAQQPSAPDRTISFDEAVEIALDQNTTLRRATNSARRGDIAVSRARMDFLPSLNFSSGGNRNFGRSFSREEGGIVSETSDFFSVSTSASVNLFNGFGDVASLNRASLNAQSGDLNLERTRQQVVFDVMNGYLNYIESQELIRVRQEELESLRQQLRQTEERVDVGSAPVSDLYQQQAQVAEAEQQLLNAERQAQLDKTNLIQTLQLDPFGEYEFETPPVEEADLTGQEYTLDRLLEQAFQRRTDLRAQQIEVRAAEENIRVAQSGYYPSINLSTNYGSNWSSRAQLPNPDDPSNPIQPSFFDQLDNRRGGSVSIGLSFPLFDRMQTRHQVEQAKVDLANAEYALQDQRQQVALQVRQAYLDYQNAEKQLDVAETRLRAAERAREAAQERYNLGAVPFVELAQANADFVSAASQRVRARYNFIFQKKLIDYYLGVLDPNVTLFQ
jgi:outer membrane protein